MGETALVSYARTPFGKFGGALRDVPGLERALARAGLPLTSAVRTVPIAR